jgi:hypothetical protein
MESREFRPVDVLINCDLSAMNFSEIQVLDGSEDDGSGGGEEGEDAAEADREERPKRGKRKAQVSPDEGEKILSI